MASLIHQLRKPISYLRTLHQNVLQLNMKELDEASTQNPYQMLKGWLLDIIQYGFILTVIINTFLGWQGVKNIAWLFTLGLLRWLILDFKKEWLRCN